MYLSLSLRVKDTLTSYSGALKSNLGHLEGGSGLAGLIKTIMVLEKGVIPPNANFESLNGRIDADFSNIAVSTSMITFVHWAHRLNIVE